MRRANDAAVPDAWDDGWEALSDKTRGMSLERASVSPASGLAKTNKAQTTRAPEVDTLIFLQARDDGPLKSAFTPAPRLLSRTSNNTGSESPLGEFQQVRLAKRSQNGEPVIADSCTMTMVERQRQAQQSREEKQRKYTELREKLFGSSSPDTLDAGLPINQTGKNSRPKAKNEDAKSDQTGSSSELSPSRPSRLTKQLYDPKEVPPSGALVRRKNAIESNLPSTQAKDVIVPIRMPKGPDSDGRSGFGCRTKVQSH